MVYLTDINNRASISKSYQAMSWRLFEMGKVNYREIAKITCPEPISTNPGQSGNGKGNWLTGIIFQKEQGSSGNNGSGFKF